MTEQKEKSGQRFCPYCDEEMIGAQLPYCQACKVTIFHCPECHKPLPRDNKVCPHCGARLGAKTK